MGSIFKLPLCILLHMKSVHFGILPKRRNGHLGTIKMELIKRFPDPESYWEGGFEPGAYPIFQLCKHAHIEFCIFIPTCRDISTLSN
jgi:hypothetical protein